MKGFRKILIAVDGSKGVLRNGLAVAKDEKCWVTVLKVVPQNDGGLDLTGIKNIRDVHRHQLSLFLKGLCSLSDPAIWIEPYLEG